MPPHDAADWPLGGTELARLVRAHRWADTPFGPVEGFDHEFRVSVRWLAEQMRRAGFEVEEIRCRGLTMRAVAKVVREPSLRLYHAGDAVDRVLRFVPGLESLSEQGMIRARRPA